MNKFQDLRLNQAALQKLYYQHYIAGDVAGAWQIIADNPALEPTVLGAENMNTLVDAILVLENLYKASVPDVLASLQTTRQAEIEQLIYVGEYAPGILYKKFNFVLRDETMLFFFQDMAGSDPTPYSISLLLNGAAGSPGLGVNWRGAWSSSTPYVQYDVVSFGNRFYAAIIANTAVVPTSSPMTWELVVQPNLAKIYVSSVALADLPEGSIWWQIL